MKNSLQDYFSSDRWEKNPWETTIGNNFDELFFDSSLELITSIDNLVSEQNLFSDFKKPKLPNLLEINSEPKQEPIFKKKFKTIPQKTITKMPEFDLDLIQELKGLQTLSNKKTNETPNTKNSTQPNRTTTTTTTSPNLRKKQPTHQNKSAFSMPSSSSSPSPSSISSSLSTTTLNSKKIKAKEKYSSLQVRPHKHTIRKRRKNKKKKYQNSDSYSQTPILCVGGKNLLAKMSQEQLNKLSSKQRKLRKIYKNRLAAKRSADRIKNKINFLGEKSNQLLQKNQNLNREITQTKMERDQLMERANELEKELKELREKEKEKEKEKETNPKFETLELFGSIRNVIESLSTIPSNKNQTEEEMILPSTINFMDQKWGTIKKKLVKNTNNRTGFAMMIVILAITFFFGNEMIFGSSTSFSIPFFSDDADYTRNLKSLDYLRKTAMEKWGDSSNIVLIEEVKQSLKDSDSDTDTDLNTNEDININVNKNIDPLIRGKEIMDSNLNPSKESEKDPLDCNFKKSNEKRKEIDNYNDNYNETGNGEEKEKEKEKEKENGNENENKNKNQNSQNKIPIDLFRNDEILENSKNLNHPTAEKKNENKILPQ
ncbi:chascon isoform d-related [Anaeramoeba flamelloides]|uniref:Chascon isoform d-related n=1 Tax=Anaeramoeba flamelloides TaxID=1746091 RepID=A0AAV8A581_9EUKA|nr:chascon isoform d-related [Anaeramoeba flamelloides]